MNGDGTATKPSIPNHRPSSWVGYAITSVLATGVIALVVIVDRDHVTGADEVYRDLTRNARSMAVCICNVFKRMSHPEPTADIETQPCSNCDDDLRQRLFTFMTSAKYFLIPSSILILLIVCSRQSGFRHCMVAVTPSFLVAIFNKASSFRTSSQQEQITECAESRLSKKEELDQMMDTLEYLKRKGQQQDAKLLALDLNNRVLAEALSLHRREWRRCKQGTSTEQQKPRMRLVSVGTQTGDPGSMLKDYESDTNHPTRTIVETVSVRHRPLPRVNDDYNHVPVVVHDTPIALPVTAAPETAITTSDKADRPQPMPLKTKLNALRRSIISLGRFKSDILKPVGNVTTKAERRISQSSNDTGVHSQHAIDTSKGKNSYNKSIDALTVTVGPFPDTENDSEGLNTIHEQSEYFSPRNMSLSRSPRRSLTDVNAEFRGKRSVNRSGPNPTDEMRKKSVVTIGHHVDVRTMTPQRTSDSKDGDPTVGLNINSIMTDYRKSLPLDSRSVIAQSGGSDHSRDSDIRRSFARALLRKKSVGGKSLPGETAHDDSDIDITHSAPVLSNHPSWTEIRQNLADQARWNDVIRLGMSTGDSRYDTIASNDLINDDISLLSRCRTRASRPFSERDTVAKDDFARQDIDLLSRGTNAAEPAPRRETSIGCESARQDIDRLRRHTNATEPVSKHDTSMRDTDRLRRDTKAAELVSKRETSMRDEFARQDIDRLRRDTNDVEPVSRHGTFIGDEFARQDIDRLRRDTAVAEPVSRHETFIGDEFARQDIDRLRRDTAVAEPVSRHGTFIGDEFARQDIDQLLRRRSNANQVSRDVDKVFENTQAFATSIRHRSSVANGKRASKMFGLSGKDSIARHPSDRRDNIDQFEHDHHIGLTDNRSVVGQIGSVRGSSRRNNYQPQKNPTSLKDKQSGFLDSVIKIPDGGTSVKKIYSRKMDSSPIFTGSRLPMRPKIRPNSSACIAYRGGSGFQSQDSHWLSQRKIRTGDSCTSVPFTVGLSSVTHF